MENWDSGSFLGNKEGPWDKQKTKYTRTFFERTETKKDENGETKSETDYSEGKLLREPSFIKLYLDDISHLTNIPKSSSDVVFQLLKLMDYEGDIYIHGDKKTKIANDLGLKIDAVNKAITQLNKAQVIIRVSNGHYKANPFFFGKGEWKNVQKIRITLLYSPEKLGIEVAKFEFSDNENIENNETKKDAV